ncbi:MAG: hypothetical protein AAB449_03340 [Patescibacteria group bacterium]
MFNKVFRFFDRLEDWIRIGLSHHPVLYALIGAVGIILVWKGVWETAELIPGLFGPGSIIMGVIILLLTGLLVSFFIGDSIILSGFKREKKLAEKTEKEVASEREMVHNIETKLDHIEKDLHEIKTKQE